MYCLNFLFYIKTCLIHAPYNTTTTQPLMAESCRHSACLNCWTAWLRRSNTCPVCRAPTAMTNLNKLVFTKESSNNVLTLTQICRSDNEESDDDDEEELEIVKN